MQDTTAQLLKGAEEHPSLHGDHGNQAVLGLGEPQAPLDEGGEQVGLRLRVVLLHPGGQHWTHIAAAHVRRVRHHHRVGTGQVLRLGYDPLTASVQIRGFQDGGVERCQPLLGGGQGSGIGGNEGAQHIGVDETLPEVPARLSSAFRAGKLVELVFAELHRLDDPDMWLYRLT